MRSLFLRTRCAQGVKLMENVKAELLNSIMLGLPECIALTTLVLVILKQKFKWAKIVLISFIVSLTVVIFRIADLNTGLHTAFAIISLALLVNYFFKVSKLKSLVATLISMLLLFLAEYLVFLIYKYVFTIDIGELAQNRLYWYLSSWPHTILLVILCFILMRIFKHQKH